MTRRTLSWARWAERSCCCTCRRSCPRAAAGTFATPGAHSAPPRGRTTNDSGGKGAERSQGQHNTYQAVLFDEAEGIPDFFYNGVKRA